MNRWLRALAARCYAGLAVAVACGCVASAACAQGRSRDAAVAAADTLAAARRHFELGQAAFAAHDYRAAVGEFALASALAPSAELWFDIARAYEELGEPAQARAAYERYLRDSVDPQDATEVRARIEQLAVLASDGAGGERSLVTLGTLAVDMREPGALVVLDGRLLGRTPLREPVTLTPGRYRLDVVLPSRVPMRAEVDVGAGVMTVARPVLPHRSDDAGAAGAPRAWTWVAVALGAGAALGFAAFTAVDLALAREGDRQTAERWATRADVALGGTVLCAVAAALLYFVEDDEGAPLRSTQATDTLRLRNAGFTTVVLDPPAAFGR